MRVVEELEGVLIVFAWRGSRGTSQPWTRVEALYSQPTYYLTYPPSLPSPPPPRLSEDTTAHHLSLYLPCGFDSASLIGTSPCWERYFSDIWNVLSSRIPSYLPYIHIKPEHRSLPSFSLTSPLFPPSTNFSPLYILPQSTRRSASNASLIPSFPFFSPSSRP